MTFAIPNVGDVPSAYAWLARPDARDIEILQLGLDRVGVVGGCVVSSTGTGNHSVSVAFGEIEVRGVRATVNATTVQVGAGHATLPRRDLVVASAAGTVSVVAGTAAATPVKPAIPANSVALAEVMVPAAEALTVTLVAAQIVSKRAILSRVSVNSPTKVDVTNRGLTGNDLDNNTTALNSLVNDVSAGTELAWPDGVYRLDPVTINKLVTFTSEGRNGRFNAWLRARATSASTPLVYFNFPGPSGGTIRNVYGGGMEGLGVMLDDAPNMTGVRMGVNTGWAVLRNNYIQGGGLSIWNEGFNNWFEELIVVDATKFFLIDGDTGMELTMRDIAMARNSNGITSLAIEIVCDNSTGIKGAVMMENVRLQSGTTAQVQTVAGMRIQAPSNISLPVIMRGVILDNLTGGPGLELINVLDIKYTDGWINTAGPSVKMTGGGRINFSDNTLFGGGTPARTYEFAGGATDGFVSHHNVCPTNWIYYLPATGGPTRLFLDDYVVAPGPLDVSNDMAQLRAATAYRAAQRKWMHDQHLYGDLILETSGSRTRVREGGTAPTMGYAALTNGTVTIATTAVTAGSRIQLTHQIPNGPVGTLYVSARNPGVSFTVTSTQGTDNGGIGWYLVEPAT